MACGVSCRRIHAGQSAPRAEANQRLRQADDPARSLRKSAFEITGTWDFKWPLETKIRVAFQRVPEALAGEQQFKDAKDAVIAGARAWNLPATLSLSFDLPDLAPALGSAGAPEDRHRSPFAATEPRKNPYDVLVSLQDLPQKITDPFRGEHRDSEIRFPVSELGSYARRADYGAPTIYLGRFGHGLSKPLVEYLKSGLGQHCIVHEFGHVLGLPHLHQHPRLVPAKAPEVDDVRDKIRLMDSSRELFYREIHEIQQLLEEKLGVKGSREEVFNHVVHVWRGNEAFSDWVPFSEQELADHSRAGKLDSVMGVPYYASMLRGVDAPAEDALITVPTEKDRAVLARMYEL